MSGAGFTAWAIEALFASTLLMIAVLLVRGQVRRAFGARVAYALWALPALRLLLPPLPALWPSAPPIGRARDTIVYLVVDPLTNAPVSGSASPGIGMVIGLIWLGGVLTFLGWHFVAHFHFCRRIRVQGVTIGERDGVTIIASAAATGPLAFGVLDRIVALPADIAERYDANERELALAHELGHHRGGDLMANWVGLALLALHWFDPIAWRAFRAFRADQELANDARVLAGRDPVERHAYACAIVKAAGGGAITPACHLHTIEDMKGRLRMLTISPASRRRFATGAASIALLTAAGLGLTASGTSAAAAINDGVRASTGVDLQIAEPVPPPPPTAPAAPIATNVPPVPRSDVSGKTTRRVVIVKDGNTTTYDGAEAEAYMAEHPMPKQPIPPVAGHPFNVVLAIRMPDGTLRPTTAADEPWFSFDGTGRSLFRGMDGKGGGKPFVIRTDCPPDGDKNATVITDKDGKAPTTICSNRIRVVTSEALTAAAKAQLTAGNAKLQARESLRTARAAIERETSLSAQQRKEALAGIADAEAELASDD